MKFFSVCFYLLKQRKKKHEVTKVTLEKNCSGFETKKEFLFKIKNGAITKLVKTGNGLKNLKKIKKKKNNETSFTA